jgi:hypothetical protein
MDKQTPTQIASEIMKGCKVNVKPRKFIDKSLTMGVIGVKCGYIWIDETANINEICLCPSCQLKILAHKMDWENELEEFKFRKCCCPCDCCNGHKIKDNIRISELTSALKILEIK